MLESQLAQYRSQTRAALTADSTSEPSSLFSRKLAEALAQPTNMNSTLAALKLDFAKSLDVSSLLRKFECRVCKKQFHGLPFAAQLLGPNCADCLTGALLDLRSTAPISCRSCPA